MTTRRAFIRHSLGALGALGLAAQTPFTTEPRKVRVGIVGGRFGATFQFHEHPDCIVEAVSEPAWFEAQGRPRRVSPRSMMGVSHL